jgi:Lipopolysaccharide-assembly
MSTPRILLVTFTTISSLLAAVVILPGCAAYQLGNGTLYNPNIRTVYIPIIRNDTFRPMVGVQLTEALVKAVELRTPYKVVGDPSADSTLTCRVISESKQVITENRTDDPRALDAILNIELTWLDRRGNLLMENRFVPPGQFAFLFTQSSHFVPESGQSISTALQHDIERLAELIVQQMESRW